MQRSIGGYKSGPAYDCGLDSGGNVKVMGKKEMRMYLDNRANRIVS